MYEKVSTNLNFVEREKKVEQYWRDNLIFEKSMKSREDGPSYVFYDGHASILSSLSFKRVYSSLALLYVSLILVKNSVTFLYCAIIILSSFR